ncbi:hypothetical protein [Glycomyces paridis]|uniref:hypothetical protein n=1 Tax=Glycomyces paridis TaxID=2126555 RepID=UPI0013053194|nr:hypothetical protein [Glycomyces paridis]
MSELQLSIPTINLLLALVHLRGSGTTTDFKELYGAESVGKGELKEITEHGLVKRHKEGRGYRYKLTDDGRLEARRLLRGARPEKVSVRTARVLWAIANDLSAHLDRIGAEFADVYPAEEPEPPAAPETAVSETEAAIREAYPNLLGPVNEWVPLRHLREHLADIDRDELDKTLTELFGAHEIVLIPESNQKTLTEADREAAVWIGGRYLHLLAIEAR